MRQTEEDFRSHTFARAKESQGNCCKGKTMVSDEGQDPADWLLEDLLQVLPIENTLQELREDEIEA